LIIDILNLDELAFNPDLIPIPDLANNHIFEVSEEFLLAYNDIQELFLGGRYSAKCYRLRVLNPA
jgi:hypothetical protein